MQVNSQVSKVYETCLIGPKFPDEQRVRNFLTNSDLREFLGTVLLT